MSPANPGYQAPAVTVASSLPKRTKDSTVLIVPVVSGQDDDATATVVGNPFLDAEATGEIDVAETYSLYNSVAIPFLHYAADAGGPQSGVNTAWNCTAYRGVWNTYALEWTPTKPEPPVTRTRSPAMAPTIGRAARRGATNAPAG